MEDLTNNFYSLGPILADLGPLLVLSCLMALICSLEKIGIQPSEAFFTQCLEGLWHFCTRKPVRVMI